jgi:hypothetical protein
MISPGRHLMKKSLLVLSIVIASVFFAACSKDDFSITVSEEYKKLALNQKMAVICNESGTTLEMDVPGFPSHALPGAGVNCVIISSDSTFSTKIDGEVPIESGQWLFFDRHYHWK